MANLFADLLGIGAGVGLVKDAYDKLGDAGSDAQAQGNQIGAQARANSAFKPFGVRSRTSTTNVDANGGVNLMLSGDQAALQDQLTSGASTFYDRGLQDQAGREQDIFQRMRDAMSPEEERQRLALESRMAAQGRTGVRTSMFGGTPEQLALAKAQEEAKYGAMVSSMEQARAEQAQQVALGDTMQRNSYLPEANALSLLQAGTQTASLADLARRQGANSEATARMGGLDARVASRVGQANLAGELGVGLLSGLLTPRFDENGNFLGGGLGGLFDEIGALFQ